MTSLNQRGSALITTLFITLLLFILGTGIISASIIELKILDYDKNHKIVTYAAEAGIEDALYRLKKEPGYLENPYDFESDDGFFENNVYTVEVSKNGNVYEVRSLGKNQQAQREVVAQVRVYTGFPELFYYSGVIFSETMGELNFSTKGNPNRSITITGNIHSNGKIILDDNVLIKGNVSLKDLDDLETNGATIEGETFEDELGFGLADIESISGLNVIVLEGRQEFDGLDYGTDKVIVVKDLYEYEDGEEGQEKNKGKGKGKGHEDGKKILVEHGDVRISGEINGRYIVIAEGDVIVDGEITYKDSEKDFLLLISLKDIEINLSPGGSKNKIINAYLLAENEIVFGNLANTQELVIKGGLAAGKRIDLDHRGGGRGDIFIEYDSRIKFFEMIEDYLDFTHATDTVNNIEVIQIDFK